MPCVQPSCSSPVVEGAADIVASVLGPVKSQLRECCPLASDFRSRVLIAGLPRCTSSWSGRRTSAGYLIDQSTLRCFTLRSAPGDSGQPAATTLPQDLQPLVAPPSLALPDQPDQVSIHELRPITLENALDLAEANSPRLKAAASQVDQAKSALRATIASWYPTVDFSANGLPEYFKSYTYRNPDFVPSTTIPAVTNPLTGEEIRPARERRGDPQSYGRQWRADVNLRVRWDIINPSRVPEIAAARDRYEQAGDSYLIALRDLRLDAATAYFRLQESDEGVRIGQDSVRASLVSLRDARARYNAGVNTKLEVLEAETQLARDRNLLTDRLGTPGLLPPQLAALLDLPRTSPPPRRRRPDHAVSGSPRFRKAAWRLTTSVKSSIGSSWTSRSITVRPMPLWRPSSRCSVS